MSLIYKSIIRKCDPLVPKRLLPLWNHEAGPKTIFFWAPFLKWSLVLGGLGDIHRPVENVSSSQCASLLVTGLVWSRYSLVIIPKNWSLFSVNILMAGINGYQLSLVIAGLGDLNRPVESLSIPQSVSLAATGIIWSRYSLVIIPKNFSLFAVNVFVACTSVYQISRAVRYAQAQKIAEKK